MLATIGVLVCVGTASAASSDAFRPAGITAADTAVDAATALVEQRPMRVDGADVDELVVAGKARGVGGTTIVRFDQELHGVPVLGGEVVVTVDARRRVLAADGEVLDGASIPFGPTISAAKAQQLARAALGKSTSESLDVTEPALIIYDARIVGGPGPLEPVLTWDLEVTNGADLRRRVFVDATTGYIVQSMDLIRAAKERYVCDAGNSSSALPCVDQFLVRSEGDPASSLADVNDAYDFAGITYDFYAALGRDSIDGLGMPMISTVRYCEGGTCPFANAFWDGGQMTYGLGFAAADDVVAHELTHGVTEYTANLLYWYQSGAINEAMSDIMGEFVDLANPGVGDRADTAANRWLMGEDLSVGPFRDMENPPVFGHPDRVGSVLYWTSISDNGGVHMNSGIVNKAAFLIADGGTFNGQTVTGIGLTKSAWLWYQTLLTLRFSSGFDDLADALDSSCSALVTLDMAGITNADCLQVTRAALATELRTEPPNVTEPAYCDSGRPADVFNDGFDSGPATNWTIGRTVGTANLWYGSSETSPDGAGMHWVSALSTNARGVDSGNRSDSTMAMNNGVLIPTGESYLRFSHWYQFEADGTGGNFDGGVVEYSVGGGSWTDIGSLTTINGYTGSISASASVPGNPLASRPGYVNASNGPVVTRVDLTTLAGQTVKFRFRIGTDSEGGGYGWYIDSARIYGCSADAPAITSISPAMGAVGGGTTITLTGDNLDSATGVVIGGIAATGVTVVARVGSRGATTVTAVTPARASSLVDVAVTTSTKTVTSSAAFRYGLAAPTIAGVSPSSGPLAGGTTITITGAELTGTTNVTVGGVPATGVTVVNATTVTAVTPAHAAGLVAVALATPGGAVAAAGAFTYANPVVAAAAATTTKTKTKTLPANGRWSTNKGSDMVRVHFVYKRGTTYTIKAVKGSTTRKGACRRVGVTVSCSMMAPTGKWKVTITRKVNGKTVKAIVRVVRT
jgi:Zn-dependent metalloprotease